MIGTDLTLLTMTLHGAPLAHLLNLSAMMHDHLVDIACSH